MAAHILLIDDEPAIQELIAVNLVRAGHLVKCAADAESAMAMVYRSLPDLILIDWMLPGMSGIDLARRFRSERRTRHVSIIMLTARASERDKIFALDAGVDDYMTKPFSPRELLARIAAVMRRRVPQATDDAVEAAGLRLDPVAGRVTADGQPMEIGATEFRLLHFLMTHADCVHSRSQLLDRVWGDHQFVAQRTVDVHIRRLRAGMARLGHEHLIQTVRGTGYRFCTAAR